MTPGTLIRSDTTVAMDVGRLVRTWDKGWTARLRMEGLPMPPNNTLLCESAADRDLLDLERRLGIRLPESYRSFLELTDGTVSAWTALPSPEFPRWAGFLPCRFVNWFSTLNASWARSITAAAERADRAGSRGRPSGEAGPQEFAPVNPAHVRTTVQIASSRQKAVVLLNPSVVDEAGEWETWDFRGPGETARRYPSFAAFLTFQATALELRI